MSSGKILIEPMLPSSHRFSCLSENRELNSSLREITPSALGRAATQIRAFLASQQFSEVILSPFVAQPIHFLSKTIDVAGVGQLRFNTEPEIWASFKHADRFYSVSNLFRRETVVNLLRRSAFLAVDFYQSGTPESLLPIFSGMLRELAKSGFTQRLGQLRFDEAQYDASIDGPECTDRKTRWVAA